MDFVNDNGGPAASNPAQNIVSDHENSYRELALRAAVWPGDPSVNNPQLYFEKLPSELPADFPLPPDTRLLGSLARSAVRIDLFLDSTLAPDQLVEFYNEKLTAAGWQKVTPSGPEQMGGFTPAFFSMRRNHTLFCQGSRGPSLSIQIYQGTNATSDVRINLDLSAENNPCDQARQRRQMDQPMRSLIPNLTHPSESISNLSGGGSGGGTNGWYSSISLETDYSPAELAAHYNSQLERAGWSLKGQAQTDQIAWSQWTLKDRNVNAGESKSKIETVSQNEEKNDEEGEAWQGFFFIFKNFENPRNRFLYVKAEKVQPGSSGFEQTTYQLRF